MTLHGGWALFNQLKALRPKLRFLRESILLWDCNIEILPELPAWPNDLRHSSPSNHMSHFLNMKELGLPVYCSVAESCLTL